MMEHIKQYTVDAFTEKSMSGNPAAIIVLDEWLSDALMQKIAIENNYSETAFIVKEGEKYHLRWFTLAGEIDLCGHATLASSYVIMNFYEPESEQITFTTLSGDLIITRKNNLFEMELPAFTLTQIPVTDAMENTFGVRPIEAWLGRDLLCVFEKEDDVRYMKPDSRELAKLDGLLQNVTAPGKEYDCISRSFAPKTNVYEDPVCGSGHCHIFSYWSEKIGKNNLIGYQASKRGGVLYANVHRDKIFLSGSAALFQEGFIYID